MANVSRFQIFSLDFHNRSTVISFRVIGALYDSGYHKLNAKLNLRVFT